jgi:tetratricopeptide (TPR) repeat protein
VRQVVVQANNRPSDEDIERAMNACHDALRADPSSAYVPFVLARLYDLRCEDDRAMASLERALELDRTLSGRILEHLVTLALQNSRMAIADHMSQRLVEFQEDETRLSAHSLSRRAGEPPPRSAYLLRAGVLLQFGRFDEARAALERELDTISGEPGDKWAEPAAIRGILRIARQQGGEIPKDLERRLTAVEAEYLSSAASDPHTLRVLASAYQWTDPSSAERLIDRVGATDSFKDALSLAIFYNAAGDGRAARRALDSQQPTERWEQACNAWMRSRLVR